MAFTVTIAGETFTEASFQGNAYANEQTGFPKALEKLVEHVANAYRGTSSDSLTVGAGSLNLTITNVSGQIPAFAVGMPVRIARTSDPAGTWMQGEITIWDGATGAASLNVDATKGSGTYIDWTITVGGHLTAAGGAPPLALSQGGTGADNAADALTNLFPAFSRILNADAGYVDFVKFGPAVDRARGGKGMSNWTKMFGAESVMADLMIAAVRNDGSDIDLEIWDATDPNGTKLTELTITGAQATCITAAGPYVLVGCDAANDGIKVFTPFTGDWAEQTDGWPCSVSNQTNPGNGGIILDIDSGFQRTRGKSHLPWNNLYNGPQPYFPFTESDTGRPGVISNIIPDIMRSAGDISANKCAAFEDVIVWKHDTGPVYISYTLDWMEDDTTNDWYPVAYGYASASSRAAKVLGTSTANALKADKGMVVEASDQGLSQIWSGGPMGGHSHAGSWHRSVLRTRAYYTGMVKSRAYAMHMMNSKTVDRSWSGYTLTETGTVTEESADGASGELKAYDFDGASYLQAADVGVGFGSGHYVNFWCKPDDVTPAAIELMYDDRNGAAGAGRKVQLEVSGTISAQFSDGSTNYSSTTDRAISLGEWHMVTAVWREGLAGASTSGSLEVYVDGMLANEPSLTYDTGMTGTIGTTGDLTWGAAGDGSSYYSGKLTMGTLVDGAISPQEIMEMYQHDFPAFQTGAKMLLRSSTTDAVLDVDIDPVTGLLDVIQADDRIQIQGAIIVNEPSIASGGTNWEHGLVWNGATLAEINDANLFASRPAMDVRGFNDRLAGIEAHQISDQFPYVQAVLTSTKSNGTGDGTEWTIGWDQIQIDTHAMWGKTARFHDFMVKVPGWYRIKFQAKVSGQTASHTGTNMALRLNGQTQRVAAFNQYNLAAAGSGYNSASMQYEWIIECDEDDTISVRIEVHGGTKVIDLIVDAGQDTFVEIERVA